MSHTVSHSPAYALVVRRGPSHKPWPFRDPRRNESRSPLPKTEVIGTVLLALLCALYCKCGDRIYTTGNGPNRRYNNEQEPLIVEGKPIPPP